MLAMVLSALAPTLAHAWVAAADDGQWIEVCSASGMVWLRADGAGTSADAAGSTDMPMGDMAQHCPWCSTHGTTTGVPSGAPLAVVAAQVREALPAWLGGAFPEQAVPGALARAPPFRS